jgi:hypothetical protein
VNGRRLAWLIVIALLTLVVVYTARHTYWEETTLPLPPKGEAATNPLYAAQKFTESLGGRAEKSSLFSVPPTDDVVLLSNWNWNLSKRRSQALERWVEAGGRLVVDHSVVSGSDDFDRWSGITYLHRQKVKKPKKATDPDEGDDEEEPQEVSVPDLSKGKCTVLEEEGHSTLSQVRTRYSVCFLDKSRRITSSRRIEWALRNENAIHVIRVKVGLGSVTVINGWPFRFRDFFIDDHAPLFAAVTQYRGGDVIHFLSEADAASLLDLTWMFGAPAVTLGLALVALALWRGSVRFGPLVAPTESARRSLAEQIRGTGRFAVRFGGGKALHAAAVRALGEAARRRVHGYENLSSEERSVAVARLCGFEPDRLAAAINYTGSRRSHDLRNVVALLEAARRRILIQNQRARHGN